MLPPLALAALGWLATQGKRQAREHPGELALLALVALGALRRGVADVLPDVPTTPTGTRYPEQGELREVRAERTALALGGLPELATQALTIAAGWEGRLAETLRQWLTLDPGSQPANPRYAESGLLLAAQMAYETRGGAAVWNYNVGNVHAARGDYFTLPQTPGERYVSFLYPLQGAVSMATRIRRLWPRAWYVLLSTPMLSDAYVDELVRGERRYFAGDVDAYKAGVRRYVRELSALAR